MQTGCEVSITFRYGGLKNILNSKLIKLPRKKV